MKAIDKFEKIINDMDNEELRIMTLGLRIFTNLCIKEGFKHQRKAVIDFTLQALNTYYGKEFKEAKKEEVPY